MAIIKAVIPAGGLGTRFLPEAKIIPKEMLPILNKPAIQYVIEEGIKAGIHTFAMVINRNKNAIQDHFDKYPELESSLEKAGKGDLLTSINKLISDANLLYVRQQEARGLGHALWSARHLIGKEHIAVLLPDDIITSSNPAISQLIQVATQEKGNVVAVQEVPFEEISRYGVIAVRKQFSPNLFQVKDLVEKPKPSDAPSNLAIIGRYVLSPGIFEALKETKVGTSGEIQLTDAIQRLLFSGEKVFAYKVQGQRYDVGTPLGLIKANINFALKNNDYANDMLAYLKKLDKDFLIIQGKAEALSSKQQDETTVL